MKLFIFFFFSTFAFAHVDCINCEAKLPIDPATYKLEEFSKRLEHWSASANQVMSAPCKHRTFDTDRMNAELSAMSGKKSKKIGGIRLTDEDPELLKVFKRLTTKNNQTWLEKLLFPGNKGAEFNFQAEFSVNPECTKVLCAVDKIWGQFAGRKLLYLNLKYGYNASEYIYKDSLRFSESELDDVLLTMADLPKSLMPMYSNRKFRKSSVPHEDTKGSYSVWADSGISIYSPWISAPQGLRFQTLVHEVGHNLHEKISSQKFKEWLSLSSWVKLGDKWDYDIDNACMNSRYSMNSPLEDFAETASAYRYNARNLLLRCPQKYHFMKNNVFRGVEYMEESQCSGQ